MDDSNNAEPRRPPLNDVLAALYQTTSQQWAHAEQIRWTLLYNYLMASTILLLAWAAVFASNGSAPFKEAVLAFLAVGGVMLSGLWVALGVRASGFVNSYRVAGELLERELIDAVGLKTGNAPFAVANKYRAGVTGLGKAARRPSSFGWSPQFFFFCISCSR